MASYVDYKRYMLLTRLVISTSTTSAEHVHATFKGINSLLLRLGSRSSGGRGLGGSSGTTSSGSGGSSASTTGSDDVTHLTGNGRCEKARPVWLHRVVGGSQKSAQLVSGNLSVTIVQSHSGQTAHKSILVTSNECHSGIKLSL
jgi:hypothetical protein